MEIRRELCALEKFPGLMNFSKIRILTPHKVSTFILIDQFLKSKQNGSGFGIPYAAQAKRRFYMLLLRFIYYPDISYKDLFNLLTHPKCGIDKFHFLCFEERMTKLNMVGIEDLLDLFDTQKVMEKMLSENSGIRHNGIIGLFIRRLLLIVDGMSISEMITLNDNISCYYDKGIRSLSFTSKTFDDEIVDPRKVPRDRSYYSNWSIKQAELFIAQQSELLENNEVKALPPRKMQIELNDILKDNPLMSQAYFLTFMNNLRVRDVFNCMQVLRTSFDRSPVQTFGQSQIRGIQYASLNLAILHSEFNHKKEAIASLLECMTQAQEKEDLNCLELANSWFCFLKNLKMHNIDKDLPDDTDINLLQSQSLNIQSAINFSTQRGFKPKLLFQLLKKSDSLNSRHSLMELVTSSLAQRAALWTLYGKNEIASIYSQILLRLKKTWAFGDIGNTDSICHVLCCLALFFSIQGEIPISRAILHHAKSRFLREPTAFNWMISECFISTNRSIHNFKWLKAIKSSSQLYIFDKHIGTLQRASISIAKSSSYVSERMLEHLLLSEDIKPLNYVRCLILQAYNMISSDAFSPKIFEILIRATAIAKRQYFQYEAALINMIFAMILLHVGIPHKALYVIKTCIETILADGIIYDKAKAILVYVKCLVASASRAEDKIRRVTECMDMLNDAIKYFKKLEAHAKVKDVYIFLATFYDEIGMQRERNNIACKFKFYDKKFPSPPEHLNVIY